MCMISALFLPRESSDALRTAPLLVAMGLVIGPAFFVPRLPPCPACGNDIHAPFNTHCQNCGSRDIVDTSLFMKKCMRCDKYVTGKGVVTTPSFYVRFCTHCGVDLGDEI